MKVKLFEDYGELLIVLFVAFIAFLPCMAIITVNMIEGF